MSLVDELFSMAGTFGFPAAALPAPANASSITEFERQASATLPASLKKMYASHDGEGAAPRHSSPGLFYGLPFLSLEQACYLLDMFRQGEESHAWPYKSNPAGAVKEMATSCRWVPFAGLFSTDYFAIDFDPGPIGKSGQILLFSTDEVERRCVADSFDEFLVTMLGHYKAGRHHPAFAWSIDDLRGVAFS